MIQNLCRKISMPCLPLALAFVFDFAGPSVFAESGDQAGWQQLRAQVQTRLDELNQLIAQAKAQGINTDYANVSVETIKAFQQAAAWDHDNVEEVRRLFKTFKFYDKTDPAEADRLAANELKACVEVADFAIAELRKQMAGDMTLADSPDFSAGKLELGSRYYQLNGRVVFPYTIFWLPRVDSTMPDALGRVGETYFAPSMLERDGTVQKSALRKAVRSAKLQREQNFSPLYHFWGHRPAPWMQKEHPEAMIGGRRFTQYDIDNPLVRTWVEQLCQGYLPPVAQAYGDGPLLYLLANEPHFATAERGWLVKNGQSKLTEAKYQVWLQEKYGKVDNLNRAHQSNHKSFESIEMPFPIALKKRGGPEWYDWCRFNMDRVNEWFAFLKQSVGSAVGDRDVAVTIKMLGHHLVDTRRDQGMDIEYLVNLQDVTGGDLRVEPHDATFYTHMEGGQDAKASWQSRYSYQWVSQGLFLDFVRSIAPEKPFFDSEWHGFGAVHWRHYKLDRNYVRAAIWHAFSNGMGMIEPWMWGRQPDGSMRKAADQIGELATQPVAVDAYGRAMKELNAHAGIFAAAAMPAKRRFMIFYSEESAIQTGGYADSLSTTYEAMKLLNFSVGLTTPTHVNSLDPKEQIVVVPPAAFISDKSLSALQDFQTGGGKIVLIGADQSFGKTEMGKAREGDSGIEPIASIAFQEAIPLAGQLKETLAPMAIQQPMQVHIADSEGRPTFGVFVQQAIDPESGDFCIILNNASIESRTVTIGSGAGESGVKLLDAITQQPLEATFEMPVYDVRLIKVIR